MPGLHEAKPTLRGESPPRTIWNAKLLPVQICLAENIGPVEWFNRVDGSMTKGEF